MSPLVLDYPDANHGVIQNPKKNQLGKSLHQCSSRIRTETHSTTYSTGRDVCNSQNLLLKFVDEIVAQILGSFVLEITDFSKFGLNSRVIFNPHCLKRRIKS